MRFKVVHQVELGFPCYLETAYTCIYLQDAPVSSTSGWKKPYLAEIAEPKSSSLPLGEHYETIFQYFITTRLVF